MSLLFVLRKRGFADVVVVCFKEERFFCNVAVV